METQYLDTWSLKRETGKLSLIDQLKLKLQKPEKTLISGLDATKLALMVDISHWQGDVDIAHMVSTGKVAMCMPKASDGKQVRAGGAYELSNYIDDWFYRNVDKCYQAKIPCAPYHYVQPFFTDYTVPGVVDWNWKVMEAAFKPLTPKVSYHAIVLDFEEKTTTNTNGATVMMELIKRIENHPQMNQVPLIIYTSMGVLNYYPALSDQLSYRGANRNLWMAQWVYTGSITTTWENLWANYIPKIEMKVITPGYANWRMLQWSAAFVLPGGNGRTDLNFFCGTKAALYNWLKYATEPEPPEPPQPPEDTELQARVEKLETWAKTLQPFQ
jgi:GH25 family lysozyme M1 (1,4-beta-N-acetylmuramidase)